MCVGVVRGRIHTHTELSLAMDIYEAVMDTKIDYLIGTGKGGGGLTDGS